MTDKVYDESTINDTAAAITKAFRDTIERYKPADIEVLEVSERFMMVSISVQPTRTSVLALAAYAASTAFATTITKEALLGLVGDLYDATTKLPLFVKANAKYLERDAELKKQAAELMAMPLLPRDGKVH